MRTIEQKIRLLPPEKKREVNDFIEFLISRKNVKTAQRMKLNWAGGLKEFRKKFTSIELQKKASEWRG